MKIRRLLWVLAGILFIIILMEGPKERKEEKLEDGTYENVYLITLKENQLTAWIEGKKWTISCPIGKEVEKKNQIVDLIVKKNKITGITWKEGQVIDQVEAIDEIHGWIWLASRGKTTLGKNWKAYGKKEGKVFVIEESGGLINWSQVLVTMIDGQVEAIVAIKEPETKMIKVLIHGEKEEIYHETVRLTASSDYEVIKGGQTETYGAGQEFVLDDEEDSFIIKCRDGKIRLLSVKRKIGFPEYKGQMFIQKEEKGYLVRNELTLEEYLYGVVSSEMPSSYPSEALKAQAVCARTYALYQMERSYYSIYGANVDDTVNSQVYNNVAETKESKAAVEETTEQYMEYKKQPIAAYFYSTSCGMTSDAKDVWIGEGENPAYLKGHFQGQGEKEQDFSLEEKFYRFITQEGKDCYEKEEPWFRWNTSLDLSQLSDHVNDNLESWLKEESSVSLVQKEKEETTKNLDSIGSIQNIEVLERSKGGVIKELLLIGKKANLKIIGEYQIRKVLCPPKTKIKLKDGTTKTCSMLPSAYFYPEISKGKLTLYGGGYGHGVGLSQNGAKAMAGLGYTYEEILDFYYPAMTLVYGY